MKKRRLRVTNAIFRKDKPFIRKDDTTTLADSFIKGNETSKPTQTQNPGPSQLTQRITYPIRNHYQYEKPTQQDTQKSFQKAIEPPTQSFSRSLRSQPTQKPTQKLKDPTLAQVSLPSPIYGLDEASFRKFRKPYSFGG